MTDAAKIAEIAKGLSPADRTALKRAIMEAFGAGWIAGANSDRQPEDVRARWRDWKAHLLRSEA